MRADAEMDLGPFRQISSENRLSGKGELTL